MNGKNEHICKPKPCNFFGTTTWQCGCGRYFSNPKENKMTIEQTIDPGILDQIELCRHIECDKGVALKRIDGVVTTEPTDCPECCGRGFKQKTK